MMGGGDPSGQVGGPGIGLAVIGGLSILVNLGWAALNLLGSGMSVVGGGDAVAGVMGGVLGSVIYGFFAILGGVVLFGGLKMKNLQSYGLAMAAAIMAMLPCTVGWCCLLGLPLGIWALIVLMKPEVKAAFR